MDYADEGNLRNHLSNLPNHKWKYKLRLLNDIIRGLDTLHLLNLVHGDLHSGNILYYYLRFYITDFGLCRPEVNQSDGKVFGVLPYIAPEVLDLKPYTKASDIYSFGIVMNEYLSGETPYNDIAHDLSLAIGICQGIRPVISKDTPKLLADLIIKCWDSDPEDRPTAKELYQILNKLNYEKNEKNSEIYSQLEESDRIREKIREKKLKEPKSIELVSKLLDSSKLDFKNLSEAGDSYKLSQYSGKIITFNFYIYLYKLY